MSRLNSFCCAVIFLAFCHSLRADDKSPKERIFSTDLFVHIQGKVDALVGSPDGSIFAVGEFSKVNGIARSNLVRITEDGQIDESLEANVNDRIQDLEILSSGHLLVCGPFSEVDGHTVAKNQLIRLDAKGQFVSSSPALALNGKVYALARQHDGKILVGGELYGLGGKGLKNIARLNPDATLDDSFLGACEHPLTGIFCGARDRTVMLAEPLRYDRDGGPYMFRADGLVIEGKGSAFYGSYGERPVELHPPVAAHSFSNDYTWAVWTSNVGRHLSAGRVEEIKGADQTVSFAVFQTPSIEDLPDEVGTLQEVLTVYRVKGQPVSPQYYETHVASVRKENGLDGGGSFATAEFDRQLLETGLKKEGTSITEELTGNSVRPPLRLVTAMAPLPRGGVVVAGPNVGAGGGSFVMRTRLKLVQ